MSTIELTGSLGPACSFRLDQELSWITSDLRPTTIVDLSAAGEIHPSVVSVLVRHQRQARRQGGELIVIEPIDPAGLHVFRQIGLCRTGPRPS